MNQFSRVSIFGASLDTGNRGVNALGESVEHLIRGLEPRASATFHYYAQTGGRRHGVSVLNCRLSPRSRPAEHIGAILIAALLYRLGLKWPARRNPWLSALLEASFIADIRGGDSLSDIYGLRRFLIGSLPLLSVMLLGRPYVLLPQTYGPFRTRTARWLAALMLRRAREVWTRDRRSVPIVEELAGRTARVSPDVAFMLKPAQPAEMMFDPPATESHQRTGNCRCERQRPALYGRLHGRQHVRSPFELPRHRESSRRCTAQSHIGHHSHRAAHIRCRDGGGGECGAARIDQESVSRPCGPIDNPSSRQRGEVAHRPDALLRGVENARVHRCTFAVRSHRGAGLQRQVLGRLRVRGCWQRRGRLEAARCWRGEPGRSAALRVP